MADSLNLRADEPRRLVHPNVSITLLCADIIAMACAIMFATRSFYWIKSIFDLPAPDTATLLGLTAPQDLHFLLLCPLVIIYFLAKGHYTQRVPWWSQVQTVMLTCVAAFVFDGFFRFALDMSVSRLMIGLTWIYLFLFILLYRQVTFIFLRKQKIWNMGAIAIGDHDTLTNILFACHTDRYTGYSIKTAVLRDPAQKTLNRAALPARYENLEIIVEPQDYSQLIKDNIDKFFIVSLETFRGKDRDSIIQALQRAGALFAIVPPTTRMNSYEMEPRYFFGYDIMFLHARTPMFSPYGRVAKRAMDIILSGSALLLLSPVMLVVALCLKLEGQGGSIFYGGRRIGRGRKRFQCWKFRSMEPNSDHLLHDLLDRDPQAKADWETYRKLKIPDPRITTRTARFIRKTSIDELPQLWNVLIGDMSLVGPRPILEDEVPLFGEALRDYLKVRPGITGLWQVSGRNDTSFQQRVYWDSWYVRNWSLWGDIVILIKTLGVVFGRKGAF